LNRNNNTLFSSTLAEGKNTEKAKNKKCKDDNKREKYGQMKSIINRSDVGERK